MALMIFTIYFHLRKQTLAVADGRVSCSVTYRKLMKYFPY